MEDIMLYPSLTLLILFIVTKLLPLVTNKPDSTTVKLPPSPPNSLPIIGHLHLLKQPLHRTFRSLSENYGPIIYLKLGYRQAIVLSSPAAVEECFTKNDIVFGNRPFLTVSKYISYNETTIVEAPYGEHWRNLRRLSTMEIFSSSRLNQFAHTRGDEVEALLRKLYAVASVDFAEVDLKAAFSELTFNIITRMIGGKGHPGEEVKGLVGEFKKKITEIFEMAEASYPGDFLRFYKWIDCGGFVKKVAKLGGNTDAILQEIVDEHRRQRSSECRTTMIDYLLSLQDSQPEYYTDDIIKGLILNMVFAGTDTSAVTLEWAMASLLNHPQVLEKAKKELDNQIGQERLLQDSDLSNLPYLQNVISETLRLYPAGPLLLPHLSSQECTLGGYRVPPNTILFVNAWAIHRDPTLWTDEPLRFKPERFENIREADEVLTYKFMPFGLGRRACPGKGLANRVLGLTLGLLIQCFDWKRPSDLEIDMTEGNGLTMPKAHPLKVMCKARHILKNIF